ncbi:hypothetical protein RI543_001067 [Arxiozyma heterogenica]|uniref:Uncharacterized protein n=1 Tax=Arxiozyma heterogenica TaxID=278026 RepID=A0AAN7W599_9SACH|nr:hypothetical protein RI543_001067 [Kazachstania heterogenica]
MNNYNDLLNISELFDKLITFNKGINKYVLDETISSFLYYLFPRDLFIRALSLLESNDMFIYVLEKDIRGENKSLTCTDNNNNDNNDNDIQNKLIENFYRHSLHELSFLFRLIVKNQIEFIHDNNTNKKSNNILHWSCSCDEYSSELLKQMDYKENFEEEDDVDIVPSSIKDYLLIEIDDLEKFSTDRFCQLDSFSLSKQRYFKYNKVMCPHLLAYAILLTSNENVLKFFIQQERTVYLLSINNINEWLKLHINIII